MTNYKSLLKNISTFIFDYDGVLTDGSVITLDDGEAYRVTNVKDGYALQLAVKKGYRVAVISGAKADCMIHRLKALQIKDIFLGVENKLEVFEQYIRDNELEPEHILFMGDDIPDYQVMLKAGIATCPADAAEEIRAVARYISNAQGGKGCVRDVIEQVLKIQGNWMDHDGYHW
ncbi:MAG: 3-deoxy-D-manno-octulosonate 8-phosphate phosphatase [Bacteroidetes bacterium]|nr:3-deoxy-D-manno-octulosonate 8-phosphate phosphatase [Bacteroidota bacterium]